MKKSIFTILVVMIALIAAKPVFASGYTLDEQKVDVLFAQAEKVAVTIFAEASPLNVPVLNPVGNSSKDPLVAILLDIFVGGLGIHRFYLGTEVLTGIGYILTCGGIFGVVPLVDLIVLAVNYDNITPFIDNPKFFMW